ncbi:MAG: hypothetical protein GC192_09485 [Bacteroidetes bacterium]|nr:hypothetical protein [Bacteroidota bacterium]
MLKHLSPLFFLLLLLPAQAKKHFEWTPALREAYKKTLSLRFVEAEADLAKIRLNDPDNLMVLHVENYLDFFHVYINEEESEFKKLEKNKDKRLEIIEDEGDKTSPYYLFLLADIRLHWALARLKFEEYSTAFFETNKAFKLLTNNAEKFPKFMPNKKDLGILHAIVGTIPDNYKWTVNWLSSMEGSMEQGKEELEAVLNFAQKEDFIYEDEIYVYYAYLMLHLENDNEEAWKIINNAKLNPAENPLACFVMANVAMRTDRGDEAIKILLKKPTGKQYQPFYYLDYMLGLAKLQRLDDDAAVYLQRYVNNYKGRNFIKDAYQKLAWHYLLQGDMDSYKKNMNLCKSRGYTIVGSDKSANAEAKSGDIPAVELLKARVLFDGGHFQRAFDILKEKKPSDYLAEKNRLEYQYRMGRITHKLGRYNEALAYYQNTIDQGRDSPYYFACRSALEKGHILEALGRTKQAKAAFNLCLDISPEDHKTGLHQQAKAGLRRLK